MYPESYGTYDPHRWFCSCNRRLQYESPNARWRVYFSRFMLYNT